MIKRLQTTVEKDLERLSEWRLTKEAWKYKPSGMWVDLARDGWRIFEIETGTILPMLWCEDDEMLGLLGLVSWGGVSYVGVYGAHPEELLVFQDVTDGTFDPGQITTVGTRKRLFHCWQTEANPKRSVTDKLGQTDEDSIGTIPYCYSLRFALAKKSKHHTGYAHMLERVLL